MQEGFTREAPDNMRRDRGQECQICMYSHTNAQTQPHIAPPPTTPTNLRQHTSPTKDRQRRVGNTPLWPSDSHVSAPGPFGFVRRVDCGQRVRPEAVDTRGSMGKGPPVCGSAPDSGWHGCVEHPHLMTGACSRRMNEPMNL